MKAGRLLRQCALVNLHVFRFLAAHQVDGYRAFVHNWLEYLKLRRGAGDNRVNAVIAGTAPDGQTIEPLINLSRRCRCH